MATIWPREDKYDANKGTPGAENKRSPLISILIHIFTAVRFIRTRKCCPERRKTVQKTGLQFLSSKDVPVYFFKSFFKTYGDMDRLQSH